MTSLELLAPARDLECGLAAVSHGADAVYIGARRFGARAAAGNSVADIAELCRYAHGYGAKVYVTVNTIIYDDELDDIRKLLRELNDAYVDAILVQDMAVLSLLPDNCRMALHASTQTDNRTVEKVKWLYGLGFSRVVLARELSLDDITAIHTAVPGVELEAFVHGALCVSYSGQCFASQFCFHRSANRGECAQFCRLAFDLVDSDGRTIERGRHLLSLKDMNRLRNIAQLADAGVVSFKIEGRLKDAAYVKNVTAAYSMELDDLVRHNPDRHRRASLGRCHHTFTPDLRKTFNRGFTSYFLNGRQPGIASPDTPKAMGEYVGRVKEIRGHSLTVAGTASFANGDGLCFINGERRLEGFRVNRAEGNHLFLLSMPPALSSGTALYRNNDAEFERTLAKPTSQRKIAIKMSLAPTAAGFSLTAAVEGGMSATVEAEAEHQKAEQPQRDNIVRQLTKLGNTIYECSDVSLPATFDYFIPASTLASMRRQVSEKLLDFYMADGRKRRGENLSVTASRCPDAVHGHQLNISNTLSRQFYECHGVADPAPAFELSHDDGEVLLMQCRHCFRYMYGCCAKHGGSRPTWREPLSLVLPDGRRFRLEFDCRRCQMNVYSEKQGVSLAAERKNE